MDNVLKQAIDGLEKSYGKGVVVQGNEILNVERLSTGSLSLDIATGGGWGKGRIVELYAPESSGKSTLCIHAMIEAQRQGGQVAFVDAEHAFDRQYAENLGLDTDKLIISQPDNGEQALEIVDRLISTGKIAVCVVDSVAALVPKAELEGEMGESKMGLHARLMSQALRKLTGKVEKAGTVLIFTNQMREKIGVMFGNPETTTGGNALKFYASTRIDLRRIAQVKDKNDVITSIRVKAKVAKNKIAPPFRVCEFEIKFGEGVNRQKEILEIATELEIIKKSGSWYSYNELKLGQGSDSVLELLSDNPELESEIKQKVLNSLNLNN